MDELKSYQAGVQGPPLTAYAATITTVRRRFMTCFWSNLRR
jgi:hypothetical protein